MYIMTFSGLSSEPRGGTSLVIGSFMDMQLPMRNVWNLQLK